MENLTSIATGFWILTLPSIRICYYVDHWWPPVLECRFVDDLFSSGPNVFSVVSWYVDDMYIRVQNSLSEYEALLKKDVQKYDQLSVVVWTQF